MPLETIDLTHSSQPVSDDDEFGLPNAETYWDRAFAKGIPLRKLPPEVLTIIVERGLVEHYAKECNNLHEADVHFLKTVRLIGPLFAHLTYVRQRLFGSIRLTPDPGKLRVLEKDYQSIGPCVRQVEFRQAEVYRHDLHPQRQRDSISRIELVLQPRVTRTIRSGRALKTWTNVLQHCSKAEVFIITTSEGSSYANINCGPPAYDLLELALQAVTATACQPIQLRVRHRTPDEFLYTKLPEWENLDLSRLQSLDFDVSLRGIVRIPGKWDCIETFMLEASATSSLLLNSSANTIQTLTLSSTDGTLGALFDYPPPALPSLRTLNLHRGQLNPETFAMWILHVPKLQQVSLSRIGLTSTNKLENWQPIFQALRQHPGALHVELSRISLLSSAGPFAYLSLKHQIPHTPEHEVQSLDVLGEMADMLMLYMSGLDEWNVEDYWGFEYVDPESDEDDEDDDEDEEDDEDDLDYEHATFAQFDDEVQNYNYYYAYP